MKGALRIEVLPGTYLTSSMICLDRGRKKGMTLFDEGLSLCFTKVNALALESDMAARQ